MKKQISMTCKSKMYFLPAIYAVILIVSLFMNGALHGDSVLTFTIRGQKLILKDDGSVRYYHYLQGKPLQYGIVAAGTTVSQGGYNFLLKKGGEIALYPDGRIAWLQLQKKTSIRIKGIYVTIPASMKDWERVDFYESGKLNKFSLAGDTSFSIGGNKFLFKKAVLEHEQFEVYESGAVKRGALAKDITLRIGRNRVTFSGILGFYESGGVEYGYLAKNSMLKIGHFTATFTGNEYHQVCFHVNGSVSEGYLEEPGSFVVGGQTLQFLYRIRFDRSGRIEQGALAKDMQMFGKVFKEGQIIQPGYDSKGTVKKIEVFKPLMK